MKRYSWARLLAYVSKLVNQELLLQIEYLAAENRIQRAHAPVRLRLSNEYLADVLPGLAEVSSHKVGELTAAAWAARQDGNVLVSTCPRSDA